MKYKCGFIGCGNMGGALLKAAAKAVPPDSIAVSNRTREKAERLALETGTHAVSNEEIAKEAEFIFLGVKPQMMGDMLSGISDILKARQDGFVLVTMAAGLAIASIRQMAGGDYSVIRIMPNTPASIGCGMTLYSVGSGVSPEAVKAFTNIMSCSGKLDLLDEGLIDAGCAVSGCGPAFVYMFLEALADGGVQCGLPRDKAMLYAAQTVIGSARLALETGAHPGALKDAVCSPGGTTIAGVHALEQNAFRGTAAEAVIAAYEKTLKMGK